MRGWRDVKAFKDQMPEQPGGHPVLTGCLTRKAQSIGAGEKPTGGLPQADKLSATIVQPGALTVRLRR